MAKVAGSIGSQPGRGGSAAALGLVVMAGAALTVLFGNPVIGLPMAGVALAILVLTRRAPVATMAIVLASAFAAYLADQLHAFVIGIPLVGVPLTARAPYVFAGLMAALLVVVGPIAAGLLRRRSALETVATLTVVMICVQTAALSALAAGAGQGLGRYAAAAMRSVAGQVGLSEELGKALVSLWPAAFVSATGVVALLVVIGVGWAGRRQGVQLQRIPPLAELDLDPRITLVPITAIAILAIGKLQGENSWLNAAGENVLVVASWIFFLQGVAVFAGLYRKAKVPRLLQGFGFMLLLVTEAIAPIVSLTGLADVWLNIRRLPRKGQEQDGQAPHQA